MTLSKESRILVLTAFIPANRKITESTVAAPVEKHTPQVYPLVWGDDFDRLPRRCLMASPEVVPAAPYGRWPLAMYEGFASVLMMRGIAVPDHPAACQVQGCGHPGVWHRHRSRLRPCRISGCACQDLVPAGRAGR